MPSTAALDDDDLSALRQIVATQASGSYKSNPIAMPGSFFVNKLLKVSNQATFHPLSGEQYPMSGETVVWLVGFRMMTIKFTGFFRQDGTRSVLAMPAICAAKP